MHAGLPPAERGAPLLPGPVFAAPTHLAGEAAPEGYGRYANPTWSHLEAAVGELEGGDAVVFASGMAAVSAVVLSHLRPGDTIVACADAYPGIRWLITDHLAPAGVEAVLVPTETEAVAVATPGAKLVWVETPSNPLLDVVDVAAVAEAAERAGALLCVDNTLATPLGQRPLDLGAAVSVSSATKSLAGHSDLLLGTAATRDAGLAERWRTWRGQVGAIPGPFEAWLAHRSIATADLRLERQSANALALFEMLRERPDVDDVRHPSTSEVAQRQMRRFGAVVSFDLGSAERAQRFLSACRLVAEATSFGGLHSTAERRARWGTDQVGEGFVRLSAGCEDTADLLADVAQALEWG